MSVCGTCFCSLDSNQEGLTEELSPFVSQTRTPRVTRLSPPQPALADQANRVSFASTENLETMSEPDIPIGFNRMNRLRQSLPLTRSSSHAKLRAPGQAPPPRASCLLLGETCPQEHGAACYSQDFLPGDARRM